MFYEAIAKLEIRLMGAKKKCVRQQKEQEVWGKFGTRISQIENEFCNKRTKTTQSTE